MANLLEWFSRTLKNLGKGDIPSLCSIASTPSSPRISSRYIILSLLVLVMPSHMSALCLGQAHTSLTMIRNDQQIHYPIQVSLL